MLRAFRAPALYAISYQHDEQGRGKDDGFGLPDNISTFCWRRGVDGMSDMYE